MKRFVACLLAAAATAAATGPVLAQPGVSVSIGINQPGVYGRINLGDVPPPPALVAPRPVVVVPPRIAVERRPIYLYVSPQEQRDWGRYCGRYAACEQPVYFVREDWVRERYVREHPDWERRHRGDWRDGRGRDGDHDRGRGHEHEHEHDREHDHDRGRRD